MGAIVHWASDELEDALADLSAQQARGIVRIVLAEIEGKALSSLLDTPGQICTSTTYYGSGERKGWKDKPEFQRALELARRDSRTWLLEHATAQALGILAETAPDAALALRQQITGDELAIHELEASLWVEEPEIRKRAAQKLGETGLPAVVPGLGAALQREKDQDVCEVIIDALGNVAGHRDGARRAAATSVLDRAAGETAAKRAIYVDEADLDAAIESEMARVAGLAAALSQDEGADEEALRE